MMKEQITALMEALRLVPNRGFSFLKPELPFGGRRGSTDGALGG